MPKTKPTNKVFQLWRIKKRKRPLTQTRNRSRSLSWDRSTMCAPSSKKSCVPDFKREICSYCGQFCMKKIAERNLKFDLTEMKNDRRTFVADVVEGRKRKLRYRRHATPHPMPRNTARSRTTAPKRYDTISSTRSRVTKYAAVKKTAKSKPKPSRRQSPAKSSSPSDVSSMDISLDSGSDGDGTTTDADENRKGGAGNSDNTSEDSNHGKQRKNNTVVKRQLRKK